MGVDRLDQRMSYYQFMRKSVKWWRKVFFWLMEVAVVNSYILYCQNSNTRRLSHKAFRQELVVALCQPLVTTRTRHNHQDCSLERLRGQHFPDCDRKRRDCRVCSDRGPGGERHLTSTFCSTCSDHPPLCIGECFKKYHTCTTL